MSNVENNNAVATDLVTMFLALDRIQEVWSSSQNPVGEMGSGAVDAMGLLMKEGYEFDGRRFGTFVNKCKEILAEDFNKK
jgi:hypothetical protein